MKKEFSEYSAQSLLDMISDNIERDEDFRYKATWTLIDRWQKGYELEPLVALLQSERTRDRSWAAWCVRELDGPNEGLREAVIALADDSLHDCRWTVPYFMINSGFYSETIAVKLVKCLVDYHLVVRKEAIKWAVFTTGERFDDFSGRVESGAFVRDYGFRKPAQNEFWKKSELDRALRGLDIAWRIRQGVSIKEIREDIPEEDSFVLDSLQFSENRLKNYVTRRKQD